MEVGNWEVIDIERNIMGRIIKSGTLCVGWIIKHNENWFWSTINNHKQNISESKEHAMFCVNISLIKDGYNLVINKLE